MNVKQTLLENFKDGTFALCTDEEIARLLRLGRREALGLRSMLHALVKEGELLSDSRYRYGTAEQFGAKCGTVCGNERGFGFFCPEDGSPDLFLPHRALNGALHGDTVLAFPKQGGEAEVLAILKRGYSELVGTFLRERGACIVRPDEKRFSEDVYVLTGRTKGARQGDKVVVRLNYGKTVAGEVTEILGRSGDFLTEELALIRAHRLREEFPHEVLAEGESAAARGIAPSDLEGRLDLRDELIITVDGEDTRDIDDAISISFDGKVYSLGVHIADVTHYVKRNSPLDREAFARGTSVYFPDRVLPMLPPSLSNGICSLNEGVDRLTLSCLMTVDGKGRVLKKKVLPSVIRSRHRMTYYEITAISDGDTETVSKYPDLVEFVTIATRLTRILQAAREKRGGVAIDIRETKILYEDGKITLPEAKRTISHEMIEQFMVLANESVATLMTARNLPFVYRVHEKPSAEKAEDFMDFLKAAGVPVTFDPKNVSPEDYRNLLLSLEGSPLYSLVNRVMLRSMSKAVYSSEPLGHFGLASDCYCHFTSPIRRYPDLCIHRIIKAALSDEEKAKKEFKDFVAEAAARSSACERNAQEAERDVDALYIVAYMADKIGEEYDATISGVTAFGLFAELDTAVEGFIPIETLPDDGYEFIETRFVLLGTRHSYRLGEGVRVRVDGVDWGARRVRLSIMRKL